MNLDEKMNSILITITNESTSVNESEFVRVTTQFSLPEASVEVIQDATVAYQSSSIATMEFFLNPATKDFFIQCFQMAKLQRKGVDFALL